MTRLTACASTMLAAVFFLASTSAALGLASRIEVEIEKEIVSRNLLTVDPVCNATCE